MGSDLYCYVPHGGAPYTVNPYVLTTGGQICTATSRMVVHEAVAPKFLELLKTRAESIKIGDPLEKGCRMGPLSCKSQHEKVRHWGSGCLNDWV